MDVEKYLLRIGLSADSLQPSLDLLRRVHRAHLLSVPFEDLTQHSGGTVRLDLPLLFDKIVNQRRGGFCYENNSLFCWLLRQLGFQVTVLAGQVKNGITGLYGPPLDHLILLVALDGGHWLCDVGFGSAGFSVPLSLDTSDPQEQDYRVYRIRRAEDMNYVEWQKEDNPGESGGWTEIYKFTMTARREEDFIEMCRYHQSSPSSIFVCKSFCTILKPWGRLTYVGRKLTTIKVSPDATGRKVETTTRDLEDEEIPVVLQQEFGIVLQSPLVPKDEPITPLDVKY